MLTTRCRIREDSGQALHIGIVCTAKRMAPVAFVSVQAGWGSPALMPIVPVGGFEVKLKHVLQPVDPAARSSTTYEGRYN